MSELASEPDDTARPRTGVRDGERHGTSETAAVQRMIDTLGLQPLPICQGYYSETWRDEHATVIHYLLPAPQSAKLHAVEYPEVFCHHQGAPARMTLLYPDGRLTQPVLGPDLAAGQLPHLVVPAGVWQATHTLGEWSLMSVIVSPPFRPEAVTLADADALCERHSEHADTIRALAS